MLATLRLRTQIDFDLTRGGPGVGRSDCAVRRIAQWLRPFRPALWVPMRGRRAGCGLLAKTRDSTPEPLAGTAFGRGSGLIRSKDRTKLLSTSETRSGLVGSRRRSEILFCEVTFSDVVKGSRRDNSLRRLWPNASRATIGSNYQQPRAVRGVPCFFTRRIPGCNRFSVTRQTRARASPTFRPP